MEPRTCVRILALVLASACGGKPTSTDNASGSGVPAPVPPPVVAKPHPGPAPTCDLVIEHLVDLQLTAAGVDRSSDAELAGARAGLEPQMAHLRELCDTQPWSSAERWCFSDIAATKNAQAASDAFAACDRAAMIERGEDMGGPTCEQFADRMVAIGQSPGNRAALVKKCANVNRAVKECAMSSADLDAFTKCGLEVDAREKAARGH